jgi:hypothetical protein
LKIGSGADQRPEIERLITRIAAGFPTFLPQTSIKTTRIFHAASYIAGSK